MDNLTFVQNEKSKKIQVSKVDNNDLAVLRYAHNSKIPSDFLRLVNRKDSTLEVESIQEVLKEYKLPEDFSENIRMTALKRAYPKIALEMIAMIWLLQNRKYTGEDIGFLSFRVKNMDMKDMENKYKRDIDRLLELDNQNLERYDKTTKALTKKSPSVSTDEIMRNKEAYSILVDNKFGLECIFNSLIPNDKAPFITLTINNKSRFKIHNSFIPPDVWLENDDFEGDRIVIRFLNDSPFRASRIDKESEEYARKFNVISWDRNNVINFSYNFYSIVNYDTIITLIESLYGKKLEIRQTIQTGFSGYFNVKGKIDRLAFVDSVTNDENLRNLLFFSELGTSTFCKSDKSVPVYYHPFNNQEQLDIRSSIDLVLKYEPQKSSTLVQINKCKNYHEALALSHLMCYIHDYVNAKSKEIHNIYIQYGMKKEEIAIINYEEQKKAREKKTGKRADILHAIDAEMFPRNYSVSCQKNSQPLPIEESKIKDKTSHKYMEYPKGSGRWYTCDPREPDDKNQDHVWIGLQENKIPEFKKKYPFIPCCFVMDQYSKGGSKLNAYLKDNNAVAVKKETTNYSLGANRPVMVDRNGDLPFNLHEMAKMCRFNKIKQGRKEVYSIMRRGVNTDKDGLIWCLEETLNYNSFKRMPINKKTELVERKKKEMIALIREYPQLASQELHFLDYERIINQDFIDPLLFGRLLSSMYECNIGVFVVDDKHPDGTIIPPFSSIVHIPPNKMYDRYIFIVRYATDDGNQCELLYDFNADTGIFEHKRETHHRFIELYESAYRRISQVKYMGIDGKVV